jgi:hypothetical protein
MPSSSLNTTIRETSLADIPEILRQRCRMYEDMGQKDSDALSAMAKLSADYLSRAMADGSFRAWLACETASSQEVP